MLNSAGVAELATRKRALVTECELHRHVLAAELAQLQLGVAAVAKPVESAMSLSRLLMGALPFLSLFFGRSQKRSRNWLKIGLFGWQLFQRVRPLWARFRMRRDPGSS